MGLFDFALNPGQRFTKEELRVLDQNFNSISAYTKNKYRFLHRRISDDISGSHYGVDFHRVEYSHTNIKTNEFDKNHIVRIDCTKYFLQNESIYYGLKEFYDSDHEDGSKIKVPKIKKFPTFVLQVGWHGNGYITEFKYNSDNVIEKALGSRLTDKCINEIEKNSIKFLKKWSK